ncbi:transposase [Oikeobacillus pervagus]|uniref:transposase n=1 Tax=Oikeobacillus pervagus TaxID=1325931 RepID=UPI0027D8D5C2|nr:transposase [Oikeobacillus pervagus]
MAAIRILFKEFSIDMSPAFIKGAEEQFPKASLTYDKFHVMKMINEAVDETRRKEQSSHPELKNSRYAWIKNEDNECSGTSRVLP